MDHKKEQKLKPSRHTSYLPKGMELGNPPEAEEWDEAKKAMYRKKYSARMLKPIEKAAALEWIGRGNTIYSLHGYLKTNAISIWYSMNVDREWGKQVHTLKAAQCLECEKELIRGAFGKHKLVKRTYSAVNSPRGEPMYDAETGRPILHLVKKEITKHPPDLTALMFFLKSNDPKYKEKKNVATQDMDVPTPEDMKAILEDKLKELGMNDNK